VAALGVAAVLPGSLAVAAGPRAQTASTYLWFDAAEAAFMEAACARLMCASQPMGVAIAHFLDEQLAGGWGAGRQLYRSGPWQAGTPLPFKQSGLAPSTWFRRALGAMIGDLARHTTTFANLTITAQDDLLAGLRSGGRELDGIPSAAFFDVLLTLTVEGFLSDPAAPACDVIRWPMHAFPGAHAARLAPHGASGLA